MSDKCQLPAGFKIVSGGQTGADVAGLDWAIAAGIAHAGWCPKGRKTEDDVIDARYALTETPGKGYLQRTEWNVRDSDASVIFTVDARLDDGSKRTADFADRHGKPWLHMRPGVHPKYLAAFIEKHGVKVLNIAGKRASSAPGIDEFVVDTLEAALR